MKILIAYDISGRHPEVKSALKQNKFSDRWIVDDEYHYLPDTTLWHPNFKSTEAAIELFRIIIAKLNTKPKTNIIRIGHLISVEIDDCSSIPGDSYP